MLKTNTIIDDLCDAEEIHRRMNGRKLGRSAMWIMGGGGENEVDMDVSIAECLEEGRWCKTRLSLGKSESFVTRCAHGTVDAREYV